MPRIAYIQYNNPAAWPSLEHSSHILARGGWQVLFLGTGGLGVNGLRLLPHREVTVRELPPVPAGWRQKLHYLWFAVWLLAWTLRWRPAWVYASDLLACPVALLLSYLPGVRVLYHEHDSPSPPPTGAFLRLCLWARRRLGRRARLSVLPNEQRVEWFVREVANGRPVLSVWNCPALEEIAPAREAHPGDLLRLLYHGSIVPARLPATVLEALTLLPARVRLHVVGYETVGHTGYVKQLQEMASHLGVGDRVEFAGFLPTRHDLLEWCRRCDVGLALMPKDGRDINVRHMVGASNKPFEYLACGLALLLSDLPDWRAMYVEPGYGLACDPDDPASIATALRRFLERPAEMRAMGERGRQRILAEWNYERQFEPVLARLNREGRR